MTPSCRRVSQRRDSWPSDHRGRYLDLLEVEAEPGCSQEEAAEGRRLQSLSRSAKGEMRTMAPIQ